MTKDTLPQKMRFILKMHGEMKTQQFFQGKRKNETCVGLNIRMPIEIRLTENSKSFTLVHVTYFEVDLVCSTHKYFVTQVK
jgi:hypothetical protein